MSAAPVGSAAGGAPDEQRSPEQIQAEEKWKLLVSKFITIEAFSEDHFTDTLNGQRRLFEQSLLDVNKPIKPNGTTMLHTAAWYQRALVIKALLELGANPNVKNKTSESTPLHFVCENCPTAKGDVWKDCLKYLVAKGADINMKNKSGKTPIDALAVTKPGFDLVKFQRESSAGASTAKPNDKAERERRIAELRKNAEALSSKASSAAPAASAAAASAAPVAKDPKLLRQAGIIKVQLVKLFDELPANPKKEKDIMEMLQEREDLMKNGYLDVSAPIPQKQQKTFLHLAVMYRASDLILYLLSINASPNARDAKGDTPLHFACIEAAKDGNREIIAALIDSGADASITNTMFKKSPLETAPPDIKPWMQNMIAERAAKQPKAAATAAAPAGNNAPGGPGVSGAKAAAKSLVEDASKAGDAIDRNLNQSAAKSADDLQQKLALGKKGAQQQKVVNNIVATTLAEAQHVADKARQQKDQADKDLAARVQAGKQKQPAATAAAAAGAAADSAPATDAGSAAVGRAKSPGAAPADKDAVKRQARGAVAEAEEEFQKTMQKQMGSKDAADAAFRQKLAEKKNKKIDTGVKNVLADAQQAFNKIGAKVNDQSKNADSDFQKKLAAGKAKKAAAAAGGSAAAGGAGGSSGGVVGIVGAAPGTMINISTLALGAAGAGGGRIDLNALPAPIAAEAMKFGFMEKFGGATRFATAQKYAEKRIISSVAGVDSLFDAYDTLCTGRLNAAQLKAAHEHLHGCDCDPYLVSQLLVAIRDHPDNKSEKEAEAKRRGGPAPLYPEQPSVSKATFQYALEQLHVACRRDAALSWEFEFLDADECGALGDAAALTLYEFNDFFGSKDPKAVDAFKENTRADLRFPTARDALFGFGLPGAAIAGGGFPQTTQPVAAGGGRGGWDFA